jgi:hypothetical protein
MSKVLTFSRVFPKYHPKAGQATYFMEKVWMSFELSSSYYDLINLNPDKEKIAEKIWESVLMNYDSLAPKYHTIRAGNRWKAGDKFSPRVWSGKPYNSKQIIIAPDIEIKKVWDFEMIPFAWWDECQYTSKDFVVTSDALKEIAKNDGLTLQDLAQWFAGPGLMSSKRKPFKGQIICWNENINY